MERRNFSTGTPWEPRVGYSRAVRAGRQIHVSGTTATGEGGEIVGIRNLERALTALGAGLADVERTRIYVTDIDRREEVGRAHAEAFGEVRPATSMAEVSRLIAPELLVEIEADTVITGESDG